MCGVVRWVRSAREVLESQPSEGKPTPKTQAVPSLPANGKAPHHSNHRDSASSRRRARFLPRPRESSYSSSRRDRWRDLRRGLHIPFNNTESRSESGYTVWCLDCFRVVLGVFCARFPLLGRPIYISTKNRRLRSERATIYYIFDVSKGKNRSRRTESTTCLVDTAHSAQPQRDF